jgi:hypothetical protein
MFEVHNARARRMQRGRTIGDELSSTSGNLTATSAALTSIATGVLALDALIVGFQNSPGTLSAADQAALDAIVAQSAALASQASAINTNPPTAPSSGGPTP